VSELWLEFLLQTREAVKVTRAMSATRRVLPTSPFKNPEIVIPTTSDFSVGDRVTHDRRGMGRVVRVDEQYVTVEFGPGDICRVPAGARGFSRL
jgi:hypothetical protein